MVDYGSDLTPAESGKGIQMNSFYVGYKYPLFGGYLLGQYQFVRGKDAGREGPESFQSSRRGCRLSLFLEQSDDALCVCPMHTALVCLRETRAEIVMWVT